ncbi:MAG: phosphatase PAP2 family protein, partial [Burkholderiales bacterium]|nr:phosphatase PAP2 family protein [Burkholderiales bacterium]
MPRILSALLLILICVNFLDIPLAEAIARIMGRNFLHSRAISNLPDLLSVVTIFSTFACWAGYSLLSKRKAPMASLFMASGISIPLAFAAKSILKWIFGRTNTRIWLTGTPDSFHWFQGGNNFEGFPSGHMLVFTPIFLLLLEVFPKLRLPILGAWLGLGAALLLTEYHFPGDVLAGAFI